MEKLVRTKSYEETEEPLISKVVREGSDVSRFITRCTARMGTRDQDERVSSSRGSLPGWRTPTSRTHDTTGLKLSGNLCSPVKNVFSCWPPQQKLVPPRSWGA